MGEVCPENSETQQTCSRGIIIATEKKTTVGCCPCPENEACDTRSCRVFLLASLENHRNALSYPATVILVAGVPNDSYSNRCCLWDKGNRLIHGVGGE